MKSPHSITTSCNRRVPGSLHLTARSVLLSSSAAFLFTASVAEAQENTPEPAAEVDASATEVTEPVASEESISKPVGTLAPMMVIGSSDAVFDLPGSGFFVDETAIRDFTYLSGNRVLDRVPGVYVREEDGFGNFPNISIRGGDGTRSEKVTLMEDGIITAPATYAAPAAYYSPNTSRMSGIEVLKGSSQVRYGPHSTGGVINYLSTPVPLDHNGYLKTTYGTDNTFLGHGYYGDVIEGDFGRFGYVAELFYKRSDGYRTIDSGIGFGGSDDTGFSLIEPMIKLFWEPDSVMPQRFEFKYGYTELDADETYVGLSERDVARSPRRRYAGTYLDNIQTEQHRTYLKYLIEPTDSVQMEIAGYYNHFKRNWYKIRKTNGESLHKVLARPSVHREAFDVLRLQGPGELGIRANSREYEAYGVQFTTDWQFATGVVEHDLHVGVRYHHDQIRRFQRDDKIIVGMPGNSLFVRRGEQGSGGNRFQEVDALALWIEDSVTFGRLTVKPGIRYEYLDQHYTDYASDSTNTVTGSGSGATDKFAPGIGFNYELTDNEVLFGGVFKGISAPGPRNYIKDNVDWEESIGYELGVRHRSEAVTAELVGFYTDFDNLVGTAAGLGQDGINQTNAGAAEVYGIETLVSYDPLHGESIGLPLFVSATWTSATLENSLAAGGGEDILAGGVPGAEIPYVPEFKVTAGIGLEAEKWGLDLSTSYVSDTFGTAQNRNSPKDSSRQGRIDGGFTVDLAAYYQITDSVRLVGGVHNLLDETMIVSRIPEGPRVNAPRQFYAGVEFEW